MNTAAGPVIGSSRPGALQMASDPATPAGAEGDFTAALAAASMADPEAGVPEDMQSTAALAWLASLASSGRPSQSQQDTDILDDSSDTPAADVQAGGELPAAALCLLQGMLAPVVQNAPRDGAAETGVDSTFLGEMDAQRAVTLTTGPESNNALVSATTPELPEGYSRPDVAEPFALVRARNADVQVDDSIAASITDGTSTNDAPADSSMGERLIGALAERVSMRTEGAGLAADVDRSAITGPNPYASAREIVANQGGQVSTRPEVVHSTVGSPRWANELGSRLALMSVRGQQEGSLNLTPEHLGPLEVRISVSQDTTSVWFGAQHADTRAALTDALPRLREMFSAAGLALGHAGVSHEMPGQDARRGEGSTPRMGAESEAAETLPVRAARITTGLLDTWA